MTSTGPDFYRQRLAHAKWTWREAKVLSFLRSPRQKERAEGRAEKHRARQMASGEVEYDPDDLSDDPCRNGSCASCHDGGYETDFERTRMAAAQRGAI